jgi:multidrug resistance efflux pump
MWLKATKVTAGQELVVLDDYNSETDLAILEKRRFEMMARKARLEAVRDGLDEIIFPLELVNAKGNELVDEVVSAQERQFKADRTEIDGQKSILQQQNAQYQSIIHSLEIQLESGQRQIELIEEEVAGVEKLLARGLERKPRLLALKRQQAALESQNADYAGQVSSYREKISETELKVISLDSGKRAEAVAELAELQANLTQTDEQWRNARLRSKELTLRANFDGTVINLNYRNVGAVVTPGSADYGDCALQQNFCGRCQADAHRY